ncbi:MAG: endospore germination permease [Bacillota bacterium]|nr:endospore germination permease [Bacillota bacterium]
MQEQISNKQAGWLVMMAVIGTVFLPITKIVTGAAGPNGWLSLIIGYSATLMPAFFMYVLLKKNSGKNIVQISEFLLSKPIGKLVGLILFFLFFYLTAMVARVLGIIYNTAVMDRTPIIVFVLAMVLLAIMAVRQGIEVLARINEILLVIVVASLLVMFFIAMPDVDINNFRPLLAEGIWPVGQGAIFSFALGMEYVLLLGVILPVVRQEEKAFTAVVLGALGGAMILLSVVIGAVGQFGAEEVLRFLYPPIQLASVLEIGDFIKGIEVLLLGAWTAASLMEISLFLYAATVILGQTLEFKDYRPLVSPLAVLAVTVALIPNNSQNVLVELEILTNLFFLPVALLLLILLTMVAFTKRGKKHAKY